MCRLGFGDPIAISVETGLDYKCKIKYETCEVAIARRAVEEGRGLVVIVNKMDLLRGKHKSSSYEKDMEIVPQEIQTIISQVMSRHSWKDQAAQPKVKYFTQVKARSPTFVAFVHGKTQLSDTDIRFLTKSLKEDFDLGGIPIRIMQRSVTKKGTSGSGTRTSKNSHSVGRVIERIVSDKRSVVVE